MTTVSSTRQVTHSTVSGGGEWDSRLNRLLEDLQGTVAPTDSLKSSSGTEYREYRMTSSKKTNDEPSVTTNEKWVEYGSRGGAGVSGPLTSRTIDTSASAGPQRLGFGTTESRDKTFHSSTSSSKFQSSSTTEKAAYKPTQVEYLTPANLITELRSSGSPSPTPGTKSTIVSSTSPKVERKEFYAKASYTTLIKGGPDGQTVIEEPVYPVRPQITSSSSSESRREFSSTTDRGQIAPEPMFTSTPLKSSSSSYSSSREVFNDRSVTPPPKHADGLKTPPLVRKILQQSQDYKSSSSSYNKEVSTTRPPVTATPISHSPIWDEPTQSQTGGTQYYTSTTTRTEHREREMSPVRRFPSPVPPRAGEGEPPKRLDELLATFDESYTESSRIGGDGGGPHKSHPYGPGTHHVRQVRIDDNVQSRSIVDSDAELIQRRPTQHSETKNVAGPPVYYPPGQIFSKTEESAMMESGGKGKAKMKMDRKYKAKEKMKSSHGEKGGEGALPVPVCLPVCCAAPCSIV